MALLATLIFGPSLAVIMLEPNQINSGTLLGDVPTNSGEEDVAAIAFQLGYGVPVAVACFRCYAQLPLYFLRHGELNGLLPPPLCTEIRSPPYLPKQHWIANIILCHLYTAM